MSAIEILKQNLGNVKIPNSGNKIFKDECVFSFDTPDSESGLYISLFSFLGFSQDYVEQYYRKTGHAVFLHHKRTKKEIFEENQGDNAGPEKKITRLAIGVEGGFSADLNKSKYEYIDHYSIVVLPNFDIFEMSDESIPDLVRASIEAVISTDSALKLAEIEANWDGEVKFVSKHARTLQQLNNGKKIPPTGWQCEQCDLTTNLWLNLTDGSILCGRKFFDGSGGNEHAAQHYKQTGYPLAVKLGTITSDGKGDVYSYDEDEMVEDPYLGQHLSHFGINITNMQKTEKSMVELELDLNQKVEWRACEESGSQLKPVYGPGRTGLVNLGNTCYMNSVMQVVFTLPDFTKRYVDQAHNIFENFNYQDPSDDFNLQMAKLGFGLCSGKYSQPPSDPCKEGTEQKGISPVMFKSLIGRGHPDFSTKKQQDALEYFLHLINVLERNNRNQFNPAECFKFQVEDKFECSSSKKVKYTHRCEYTLPLPIPLEAAVNKEQVTQYELQKQTAESQGIRLDSLPVVRPHLKFFSCLETFLQPESVKQFYSTAINGKTTARKLTKLATFPDYLMIHLKKFTFREDWVPIKLDVSVDMPDVLDLSQLRGMGPQPGEECLPEPSETDKLPAPVFDEALMKQLLDIGFPAEACKKALYFTQSQGPQEAMEWLMTHSADTDFADTFVPPGTAKSKAKVTFVPDEESVATVMSMGFTSEQAIKALRNTDNNVERAVDWIFSHVAELDAPDDDEQTTAAAAAATAAAGGTRLMCTDGEPKYRLRAFITHMGTSTMVGHYVCHILKDEQWIIFNDNKVALSENPPKDLGYLYLYERI